MNIMQKEIYKIERQQNNLYLKNENEEKKENEEMRIDDIVIVQDNKEMKIKKKVLTDHQRAVILMNRETNRAVNHVKLLEKLYLETLKAKETVK